MREKTMTPTTEIEQLSLIGYLLSHTDSETSDEIIAKLTPEHFTIKMLSEIYRSIKAKYTKGETVDVIGVLSETAANTSGDVKTIRETMAEAMNDVTASTRANMTADKLLEGKFKADAIKALTEAETLSEALSNYHDIEDEYEKRKLTNRTAPENVKEYIERGFFDRDLQEFQQNKALKTGFENLDEITGGLYSGLYVLGAISSLGKTTFIHQMADNIASTGTRVIYFSLEQSSSELISKSIAREAAKTELEKGSTLGNLQECKPAIYYRTHGTDSETAQRALTAYRENIAPNIQIEEGNFSTSVESIREFVFRAIKRAPEHKPVVIIDYLQILQNRSGFGKEAVDHNITELKRLSRDYNIPVIVISSFNRSNYMTPVSFESFKESGGIEYTADVIYGLQLEALNEDMFNGDEKKNIKQKRERVKAAKEEIPRKIQLVCLKNRFGATSFDTSFLYNPKFDIFIPATPIQKAREAGATSLTSKRPQKKRSIVEVNRDMIL